MKKNMDKAVRFLYRRLRNSSLSQLIFPKSVQRDIQFAEKSEEEYYVQKLMITIGLMFAAIVFAAFYLLPRWQSGLGVITWADRPEAYEKAQELSLRAGKYGKVYSLDVNPLSLDKEEAEAQLRELLSQWESLILGENESAEQIKGNMVFPEQVEGYPFEIYWESDKEELINTAGQVNRTDLKEDSIVMLKAIFYYRDWMWTEQFAVVVKKEELSAEEQYHRDLEHLLWKAEEDQQGDRKWKLPESFQGEPLVFQKPSEDLKFLILAGMMPLVGAALWIGKDRDLRSSRMKYRKEFQTEYISLVESLSLYLSAGLNLSASLKYCTNDYVKRKPKDHLLRKALEEFQKDIQNGYGFSEAIGRFADTADDMNYRRLVGLLNQSLLNGSQGLASVLEQEADKLREEKKRQCKVVGEQVSTALIAPMMLQLGIVIALIMIPAFTGMKF